MRGVDAEALAGNAEEGLRHETGNGGIAGASIPAERALGKSFNENDAERPDVGGRRHGKGSGFGGVVFSGGRGGPARTARNVEPVGGKLELIVDDEDVGGLEMAVDEFAAMEPGKRVENRRQHFPGFGGGEGTLAKEFGKDFVGVVGNDVEEVDAVDFGASGVEDTDEVGMGQGSSVRPLGDAGFGIGGIGGGELNGSFAGRVACEFGEEDAALPGTAQPPEKGEPPVDGTTDAIALKKCRGHERIHSIEFIELYRNGITTNGWGVTSGTNSSGMGLASEEMGTGWRGGSAYTVAQSAMRVSVTLLMLALLPASAARAAKLVTVDEIEQTLAAAKGESDAKVAEQISSLEAGERIDSATLARWQAAAPGERTREALLLLADGSAFLPLGQSRAVDQPAPDAAELHQIIARTIDYLGRVLHNLPNFMAVRETTQFEDSPWRTEIDNAQSADAHQNAHSMDSVQLVVGKPWWLPLSASGRKRMQVSYRDGHEVQVNLAKDEEDAGLRSRGEFGPVLAVAIGDAFRQKLYWNGWEHGAEGNLATFRYVVPASASHYVVEYPSEGGVQRFLPAYHGEIAIDPASGTVYRLTLIADMPPPYERTQAALVVEYGAVVLGERSYICPLRSVNLTREPLAGESEAVAPVLRTFLNDVAFTNYHLFRAESRIVGTAHTTDP